MNSMRIVGSCLLTAVLVPSLTLAADKPALGAATPEELVSRLQTATKGTDPIAMAALLTPEARAEMSAGLTIGGLMMVAMQGFGLEMAGSMGDAFGDGMDEAAKAEAAKGQEEMKAKIEASTKRLEGILERYGLPNLMDEAGPAGSPEEAMAVFEKIDHIGYLGEMFAFFRETFPEEGEPPGPASIQGEIGKPTVSGDKGTVPVGDETYDIVKIDGRWYFSPPSQSQAN